MELEFTADQDELRDSIRAVLAKESPIGLARRVAERSPDAPDAVAALWTTMAELGWPSLAVAEADGGIGLGAVEVGILAEELGRNVTPGPLLSTVTQFLPAVRELGTDEQRARFASEVAAGTCRGTLATIDDLDAPVRATLTGDGLVLTGTKRYVIEADNADEIAVVAQTDDSTPVVAVVAAADATITPVHSFDPTRSYCAVTVHDLRVAEDRVLRGAADVRSGLDRVHEEAATMLALEMVGAAQSAFDVTLEYAKQREQFGVPIGSFQAIKHKLADMVLALERARATSCFAALCIAEDDERRHAASSVAKAAAGDCERLFGKETIQIHGGIGVTWEHDMHLYVKRLKTSAALFGDVAYHRARIADLIGV